MLRRSIHNSFIVEIVDRAQGITDEHKHNYFELVIIEKGSGLHVQWSKYSI